MVVRKLLAVSTLMILLAVAAPVSAEGPTEYACDSTGRLVCTGTATGGNVVCDAATAPVVNCDYTYGWSAHAFSPLALPGDTVVNASARVEACSSTGGCSLVDASSFANFCTWATPGGCHSADGGGGSFRGVPLDLGECLTLRVIVDASASAQVPPAAPLPSLAQVHHVKSGEAAGQVCHVDDGR